MNRGSPRPDRSPPPEPPPAKGAKRLLWGLVLGIVVLNLLIFLATLRERGPSADRSPSTNAGPVLHPP